MNRFSKTTATRAVILALLIASRTEGGGHSRDVDPLLVASGTKSGVVKRSYYRIDDEASWKLIWQMHDASLDAPATFNVNFKQATVIAIFDGKDGNNRGIDIIRTEMANKEMVVHYQVKYYGVGASAKPKETTSFAFVVLPKIDVDITIEETINDRTNKTSTCEHRVTLKKK